MTAARYKDLCIDAVDVDRMAAFWAAVLGLERRAPGSGRLDGPTPQHGVWINPVPDPVTVKQRVHLDVPASSVEDVLALGATPVDLESFSWKVVRDPEGGELCVFEREEVPAYRLYEIAVDARDPLRLATWWADLLGGELGQHESEPWAWVKGIPGAPFDAIVFGQVPEPKTVKNRIHWDVDTPDLALLTGDGATVVRARDDEISWTVLADPEGNEFCAFTDDSAGS